MSRTARMEAALINLEVECLKDRHDMPRTPTPRDDGAAAITLGLQSKLSWELLARYETRAQSAYYRALDSLRKLQKDRKDRPAKDIRNHQTQERYLKQTIAKTKQLAPFGQSAIGVHLCPSVAKPKQDTIALHVSPDERENGADPRCRQ